MSETVKVSNLKEAIAECPICTEFFNDTVQIPRRMPCCSQAVCERCLVTIARGRTALTCPMCNTAHSLSGGVKSLPKEALILRFLEALKTERNAVPLCTDCPDDNRAMSKCDKCGVYLCQPCLAAHKRHKATRDHKTTTFDEMQTKWQSRPSTAKRKPISELKVKLENVSERVEQLSRMLTKVDKSKTVAQSLINERCDELINEVQKRRAILLSQLEDKADKEKTTIKRALDSHKQYQEKLKKASTEKQSPASTTALLQESPTDLKQQRVGVIFTEANVQHILEAVRSAGLVRVVTFTPAERPAWAAETSIYDAVNQLPADFNKVSGVDQLVCFGGKEILCPHLEWNRSLASNSLSVTSTLFDNAVPKQKILSPGCKFRGRRRVLSMQPVVVNQQTRILFKFRIGMCLKQVQNEKGTLCEISLMTTPIDTGMINKGFVDIYVHLKDTQEEIMVGVATNDKVKKRIRIARNQIGATFELSYCILLDGVSKKIHLINTDDGSAVVSENNALFDSPLWLMASVRSPDRADTTVEIITGHDLKLEPQVKERIVSLL